MSMANDLIKLYLVMPETKFKDKQYNKWAFDF